MVSFIVKTNACQLVTHTPSKATNIADHYHDFVVPFLTPTMTVYLKHANEKITSLYCMYYFSDINR